MCFFHIIIEEEREIEIIAMNCVFSGPPRVGKSSLLERLMGKQPKEHSPSTGIVGDEGIFRVDLKPSYNIVTDQEWSEMQEEDEVHAFLTLTMLSTEAPVTSKVKTEKIASKKTTLQKPQVPTEDKYTTSTSKGAEVPSINISETPTRVNLPNDLNSMGTELPSIDISESAEQPSTDITVKQSRVKPPTDTTAVRKTVNESTEKPQRTEMIMESDTSIGPNELPSPMLILQKALQHNKQIEATRKLRKRHFLYLTDTGGQPEFRQLLPLFLSGPTNAFIVFNLCHDFHSQREIEYVPSDVGPPIKYECTFCVKEVINEIFQNTYCSKLESKVLFIGTHKDKLSDCEFPVSKDGLPLTDDEKIECRNKELQELLIDCPYYDEKMVVKSDQKNFIFCVDNMSLNKSHSFIRSAILGLCDDTRFKIKVKPSWLLFALTLKGLQGVYMSYKHCTDIAEQCGIEKGEVKYALRFLHQYMSTLRYYECAELRSVVIVKPNVLTNKLSKLLRMIICKRENVTLNHSDINGTDPKGDIFPTELLIDILKYLKVIAPIQENEEVRQYIFPCMMLDSQPATPPSAHQLLLSFKHFKFQVPKYLQNAILTSLLQNKEYSISLSSTSKTKIAFRTGVLSFELLFRKECIVLCPIDIKKISGKEHSICNNVEECIEKLVVSALTLLGYSEYIPEICFQCPCDSVKSQHFAEVFEEKGVCFETGLSVKLPTDNIWFSQVLCVYWYMYNYTCIVKDKHY